MLDFIVNHWKTILVICLSLLVFILNIISIIFNRLSNKHLNKSCYLLDSCMSDLDFHDMSKYIYAVVPEFINIAEDSGLTGPEKLKMVVNKVIELLSSMLGRAFSGKELDALYANITNFVESVLSTPQKKS